MACADTTAGDGQEWIINELEQLRAATMLVSPDPVKYIDAHLPTIRRLHGLLPRSKIRERVGSSYVLGLMQFIRFTARPLDTRSDHTGEIKEALRLLEWALQAGTEHNLLSRYLQARMRVQLPGGFYNQHEHELRDSLKKLPEVQAKLIAYDCIRAAWQLHELGPKEPTAAHDGVVFGATLGELGEARRFHAAMLYIDSGFADPMYCGYGLSPLGADPMVARYIKEIYE